MELAQLRGDRDVALGVAEADRRGDVEGALAAGPSAGPPARRPSAGGLRALGEIAHQQVDLHRVAGLRAVARALEASRTRRR